MSLKQITQHLRSRIKAAGVSARVRMSADGKAVQVIAPSFDAPFNAEQYKAICFVAKCNNLTFVRGQAINPDLFIGHGCSVHQIDLYK